MVCAACRCRFPVALPSPVLSPAEAARAHAPAVEAGRHTTSAALTSNYLP